MGSPGDHDRTLAIKSRKNTQKSDFFRVVHAKPPGPKKVDENTPGTVGSPGGGDRTLAVKSRQNT